MKIDGHAEVRSSLEERQESGIVEKKAVGGAVHERTVKAEVCDRPFKLHGCGIRVFERECGEAAQSARVGLHRVGKLIVNIPGECAGCRCIQQLNSHGSERENLKID